MIRHAPTLLLLLLAGCVHRVHTPAPKVVDMGRFEYVEVKPGVYLIYAYTAKDIEAAKAAIGCGVCIDTASGVWQTVKRISRKGD